MMGVFFLIYVNILIIRLILVGEIVACCSLYLKSPKFLRIQLRAYSIFYIVSIRT